MYVWQGGKNTFQLSPTRLPGVFERRSNGYATVYRQKGDTLHFDRHHAVAPNDREGSTDSRGELDVTEREHANLNDHMLRVGSTKVLNGVTYRLNKNHRWERAEDAQPAAAVAAEPEAAPEVKRSLSAPLTSDQESEEDRKFAAIVPGSPEFERMAHDWATEDHGEGMMNIEGKKPTRKVEKYYFQLALRTARENLTDEIENAKKRLAGPGEAMTPAAAHAQLQEAMETAQAHTTPEAVDALRAAVKTVAVVTGQTDGDTPHTVPNSEDTEPEVGQRYLVGLPDGVKDRQRRKWNDAAAELIDELRASPRETTEAERQLLARYSGNGGIGASLNEYYTPPELGEAMWAVLDKLGSGKGRGLEPSSGPGVLVQFAPDDATMDVVELSPLSAGIANVLFGHRHDVHTMSFEAFNARNPDAEYKFATGNPPFCPRDHHRMLDERYQEVAEESRYFTLRTLDRLEEGGIATLILPAGICRNKNDAELRARILARAEIVAIHGLPTNTFSRAGTESATTDLWVLRARPKDIQGMLDAGGEIALRAAGVHDEEFVTGRWHQAHPEQMHATVTKRAGIGGAMMYARDGELSPELLSNLVTHTPVPVDTAHPTPEDLAELLKDYPKALAGWYAQMRGKEGDTRTTVSGQLQMCMNGRWHNIGEHTKAAITAANGLSDLINMHATQISHEDWDTANGLRPQLENLLKEYLTRYGNPHQDADLQRAAKESAGINNLLAVINKDGSLADTVTKDAQSRAFALDKTDMDSVATYLRREKQDLSTTNVRRTIGADSDRAAAETLMGQGYCYSGQGNWKAPGDFYSGESGDVEQAIARLEASELPEWARLACQAQRAELDRRVPRKSLEELDFTPRDGWVPIDSVLNFLANHSSSPVKMMHEHNLKDYYITRDEDGKYTVGTSSDKSKSKGLNIVKRYLTGEGRRTDEADLYADLDDAFADWAGENDNHRLAIEEAYRARGTWLEPTWDTRPVQDMIPGWRSKAQGGVDLHPFQSETIHRSLQQGNGIMALDVGLGKTPTAIALTLLAREQGLARKPVVAVPKSVVGNWREKTLKVKPDAKILVVGAEPKLGADGVQLIDEDGFPEWSEVTGAAALDRQLAQMKTGDYDMVLMTHTTLGRVQFDPVQQLSLIESEFYAQGEDRYGKGAGMGKQQFEEYTGLKAQAMIAQGDLTLEGLQAASSRMAELDLVLKEEFPAGSKLSDREKKDKKKKKEERARLLFMATAYRALSKADSHPLQTRWNELGVDHIVVDEGHCFPAGTLVDGTPIESYGVGDFVTAFDHGTGQLVKARITGVDRRPLAETQELYRLTLTDGRQVVSTGNHPYFTQDGYIFARHLKAGDSLYLTTSRGEYAPLNYDQTEGQPSPEAAAQGHFGGVPPVQNGFSPEELAAGTLGAGRNRLLLREELQHDVPARPSSDTESEHPGREQAQSRPAQGTAEGRAGARSAAGDEGAYAGHDDRPGAPTHEARGQRTGHVGRADGVASGALAGDGRGVGSGARHSHPAESPIGLPDLLQSGLGRRLTEGRSRSGRPIALIEFGEGPRPEETGALGIVRVASVEVLQPGGRSGRDGLCPDGYVYNLEVETHHNYFAEGILVHNSYKGLWAYAQGKGSKTVKYLGAPQESSQRAVDLYYKTKAMRASNDGRGVYLLTATPIKNSPVELFSMLSYTAPQIFKKLGIHNLDQFIDRYCRIEQTVSVDEETGEASVVQVLAGLKNLSELRREVGRVINRKTAAMVGLPLPHNDESNVHVEPNPEQADLIKWVAQNPVEAARLYLNADVPEGLKPDDEEYAKIGQKYALAIPHITRRAELDMELIDPVKYRGYVSPKVKALLDELKATVGQGQKAVVFSDVVNMPAPHGSDKRNPNGYSFHEKLRRLIAEHTGIRPEEIAIVNAQTCPTGDDRLEVARGLKSGKYKVVLGNTGTMGEGINLQHGVQNLLHLDVPWNPAVWQQRVGRVVRQGNTSKSVNNKTFLGTRGLDKDMYDTLKGKGVWYDEFWNGESDSMDAEGGNDYRMTPERLAALALDDPAERTAAMEQIKHNDSHARTVGQRLTAIKTFSRFQAGSKALSKMQANKSRAQDKWTEAQQGSLDALQGAVGQYRARLEKHPGFAPYLHALDNPAGAILDAASGKAFTVGERRTFTSENGVQSHRLLFDYNPRTGMVKHTPIDMTGAVNNRGSMEMHVSDIAQADSKPWDQAGHVEREVQRNGMSAFTVKDGHLTRSKHLDAARRGMDARMQDKDGSGSAVVLRGDEMRHVSAHAHGTEQGYMPGDQIMMPGHLPDTSKVSEWMGGTYNYDKHKQAKEAGFEISYRNGTNGNTEYYAKADTTPLSVLYTQITEATHEV